jgi:uncharacterized protein YjeT (DUF2065 family)
MFEGVLSMLVPQVVETKAARSCERRSQAKLQGPGVGLIACGKIE